ncbi:MAG: hypothetical protein MJZ66_06805 [Bacteroidales bacterium]|nr:hypothetical protein [Bacteroidales bacterium]
MKWFNRKLKNEWDACAVADTDNWRFERGRAVGVIEGKFESALKMYNKGYARETIIDVLELSDGQIAAFEEEIKKINN